MAVADPVEHDLAVRVTDAVTGVPGVAAMHAGDHGEIALLYPGERMPGLRLRRVPPVPRLEVHVIVDLSATPSLHELSQNIHSAVRPLTALPVDVVLADAVGGAGRSSH